jgi:tetratricopeptide (TPR) repeat protein
LLEEARSTHFPDLTCRVSIHFVDRGPLACVCPGNEAANIYIHQLLNHDQTPREVIGMICKHELLHLRIPPVANDGEVLMHPPAFWVAERAICPEHKRVWAWIWTNLGLCLKHQPKLSIADCSEAIRLNPKHVDAHFNRAIANVTTKEYPNAVADYSQAIRLSPDHASAYCGLAWVLATCPKDELRDGKRAVELATKACELSGWKDANCSQLPLPTRENSRKQSRGRNKRSRLAQRTRLGPRGLGRGSSSTRREAVPRFPIKVCDYPGNEVHQ